MENILTAVFEKVPEGYIGYVEELPGANSQGETLDEVRENLKEAIGLVLESNRHQRRLQSYSLCESKGKESIYCPPSIMK